MGTVAQSVVATLAAMGVRQVWGVDAAGGADADPLADALRGDDRLAWVACGHGEAAAFAAGAQAELTGALGVCMAPAGPGVLQVLNGLYDAATQRSPLLVLCGRLPLGEPVGDQLLEPDLDAMLADVAVYHQTVISPAQLPTVLEEAVRTALEDGGVAALTLPLDVAAMPMDGQARHATQLPADRPGEAVAGERPGERPGERLGERPGERLGERPGEPRPVGGPDVAVAPRPDGPPRVVRRSGEAGEVTEEAITLAAQVLQDAHRVSLLVGPQAAPARDDVLALADRLAAPIVLTSRAKTVLEDANPFEVGLTGPLGNPAAERALEDADTLLLLGSGFPHRAWYPSGKHVIQIDSRAEDIGRRVAVDVPVIAPADEAARRLLQRVGAREDRAHLESIRGAYADWMERQARLSRPEEAPPSTAEPGMVVDLTGRRVRPQVLAAAVDRHADDDAVFTADGGMPAAWLSRLVRMRGRRQLVDPPALATAGNALPQALGAQALDRDRQVVAFCSDTGLAMRLGELITAVAHDLPVTLVVFDTGASPARPDLSGLGRAAGLRALRVATPGEVDEAVRSVLTSPGPALIDVPVTGRVDLDATAAGGEAGRATSGMTAAAGAGTAGAGTAGAGTIGARTDGGRPGSGQPGGTELLATGAPHAGSQGPLS